MDYKIRLGVELKLACQYWEEGGEIKRRTVLPVFIVWRNTVGRREDPQQRRAQTTICTICKFHILLKASAAFMNVGF